MIVGKDLFQNGIVKFAGLPKPKLNCFSAQHCFIVAQQAPHYGRGHSAGLSREEEQHFGNALWADKAVRRIEDGQLGLNFVPPNGGEEALEIVLACIIAER